MKTFFEYRMADVSTVHIMEKDRRLILHPDAPDLLAQSRYGHWSIFVVCLNGRDDKLDQYDAFREFGFSEYFVDVIQRCAEAGISYVKFDGDGYEYEDLPKPNP